MTDKNIIDNNKENRLSREEEAKLWLENTEINRKQSGFLVIFLIVTILIVPIIQFAGKILSKQSVETYSENELIASIDMNAVNRIKDLRFKIPSSEEIKTFESHVEDASIAANFIQPYMQYILTNLFGAGNEQVYKGTENWLFYRDDVDYIIGSGFLNRRENDDEDPVVAISDLNRMLSAKGIKLIVAIAASKPSVYPELMSARYSRIEKPLANASYARFADMLKSLGIEVFYTGDILMLNKIKTGNPQFLASDTHWTPETVSMISSRLADTIKSKIELPPSGRTDYSRKTKTVTGIGDIAVMLRLPKNTDDRYRSTVKIDQVYANDKLWKLDRKADILLLGDSYSNIYSMKGMGWGESAGIAEQLSFYLKRPVDKIAMNAGGAYSAREELNRQILRDPHRLDNVKVVVYEFAERELSSGEWKKISYNIKPTAKLSAIPVKPIEKTDVIPAEAMPEVKEPETVQDIAAKASSVEIIPDEKPNPPKPTPAIIKKAADSGKLIVNATVGDISKSPKPGEVPYKDCIIAIHLKDIEELSGNLPEGDIVVFVWGMKDNKLLSAADIKKGQNVKLELTQWSDVESEYGSYNRIELEDDDLLMLDVYWGKLIK